MTETPVSFQKNRHNTHKVPTTLGVGITENAEYYVPSLFFEKAGDIYSLYIVHTSGVLSICLSTFLTFRKN